MPEHTIDNRLRPIEWLASLPHLPDVDMGVLARDEEAAQLFYATGQLVPTIGCEVEIKSSTIFPELAANYFGSQDVYGTFEHRYPDFDPSKKKAFDEAFSQLDKEIRPWYEATKEAGIPQGNDAFWEFANSPTYAWQTLAAEVGLLFDSSLIPSGFDHSLHVTLGGLEIGRGGMGYILGGLELLFVSPERLEAATMPNRIGTQSIWARRGANGLRTRYAGGLRLGQVTATELRTLTVSSAEQSSSILEASQLLGALLAAYRSRQTSNDPMVQELVPLWDEYRSSLKELWNVHDLPLEPWGMPKDKPLNWKKWAGAIALRGNQGSQEQETVVLFKSIVNRASIALSVLTDNDS